MKEYKKICNFLEKYQIKKCDKKTYCVFEKDFLPLFAVEGNSIVSVYFQCFIDEDSGKCKTHRINKQREIFFSRCQDDKRIDFYGRSAPVGKFATEEEFISFLNEYDIMNLVIEWYEFLDVQKEYELKKETLKSGTVLNYRVNIPTEVEIMRDVFKNNEYIKKGFSLREDDVVLDLGGNIGSFSIRNFKSVKRIIAFEPESVNCNIFRKNIEENKVTNVELFEKAVVGNDDKKRIFYLGRVPYYYSFYVTSGRKGVTVDCVNINEIVRKYKPTKMKIDVEGSEYEILLGCSDFSSVKQIIFEYNFDFNHDFNTGFKHFDELIEHLRKNGFDVSELTNYKRTKNWAKVFLCNKIMNPTKKKIKILAIQPHSDDLLLSASHVLLDSDVYEVHVLCVESDPKRVPEDEKLYKFLGIPYQHLNVEFIDNSYYEFRKEHKTHNVEEVFPFLDEYFGAEVVKEIRTQLISAVREFLRKHPDYGILAPMGIGHPFHLFVHETIREAFPNATFYREFPHSYKKRAQEQLAEAQGRMTLIRTVPIESFADVKWQLASKFYRTQSGLLFYEQGYIKKNLPEEVYEE